mmetsp:Transcript_2574/g.10289  ORF Transcript_2574/g.10289 Transcript_2574/m.10289 type:complete len:244 (-) Transcript_2574:678-1409(-)
MAATRRGCVQPTLPMRVKPHSCMYCVICVVLPEPVSPTTTTIWFSRTTVSSSSRTSNTGRNSRCSRMVFVFANALEASCFAMECSPSPNLPLRFPAFLLSSASTLASSVCSSSSSSSFCFSLFCAPRRLPSRVLCSSQNRSRLLVASRFSRIVCSTCDPLRARTAMSLVGSLTGSSVSAFMSSAFLFFPARNGGRASCTSSTNLASSSALKSKSTSPCASTPLRPRAVASQAAWSLRAALFFR